MKKQYIKPKTSVVVVNLEGSILDYTAKVNMSSLIETDKLSREADRFWDDEEESIEVNIWK